MNRPQAIVTLDQGNSSTKVVVYDAHSAAELACLAVNSRATLAQAERMLAAFDARGAIGCSVANGRDLSALMAMIDAPEKMELRGDETPVPLRNLYGSPETLGPDRLAAAVGAAALFPGEDLLVADIGTAVTFDVVTAEGEYLGGNIAPGPGMRLRALNSFTARLPLVSGHADFIPGIGSNTVEALRCGAMRGVVAELLYYSGSGQTRRLVLSGGWAPEIAALLPDEVDRAIAPHLVNFGLLNVFAHSHPCLSTFNEICLTK